MEGTKFPVLDFGLQPEYVRPSEGNNGDICLCLVPKPWTVELIRENKSLSSYATWKYPRLTNLEVPLALNQPHLSYKTLNPAWELIQLHRIKVDPNTLTPRLGSDSDATLSSDLQTRNVLLQSAATLRKYPRSVQSLLHPNPSKPIRMVAENLKDFCSDVLCCAYLDLSGSAVEIPSSKCHPNILCPLFVAAFSDHFVLAYPYQQFTMVECLGFTSNMVSGDSAKYFILYQVLKAVEHIQEGGFFCGKLSWTDFAVKDNLWIQLIPSVIIRNFEVLDMEEKSHEQPGKPIEEDDTCKISEWTTLWCLGKITNFDYLLALNQAAGRLLGHPDYHPIMPWVSNFQSPVDGWRDLKKSKYRLTKGDHQLDLTYGIAEGDMVAHHIPETFSDLTFYIYKARQIPKTVLCQHVRKRWVPAEYPSTMERLYKWSPDECIPEFYCDPSVFSSIHEDLPDLGLPYWCKDIEDFLKWHRSALESDYVSQNFHHWIDLNFGYKLSGEAAINAKNVVLSRQTKHLQLRDHGIRQLFPVPHPKKFVKERSVLLHHIPTTRPKMVTKQKTPSERSIPEKERNVDGGSLHGELEEAMTETPADSISVCSFTLDDSSCDVVEEPFGILDNLNTLEQLIDFAISVDHEFPSLLEDFVKTSIVLPAEWKLESLRDDVHAFICLAVELFCKPEELSAKTEFSSLSAYTKYARKLYSSNEHQLPTILSSAFRGLISSRVMPFGAGHLLRDRDSGGFPFPKYMETLHRFLAGSLHHLNVLHLERILEEMDGDGFDILEVFLVHLLQTSPDKYKLAFLLMDPIAKFITPSRMCQIFLPILHRFYLESPVPGTATYNTYLMLFEQDFFVAMIVRLGLEKFLKFFVVALIEKLTDSEEIFRRTSKIIGDFESKEDEPMFSVDGEDFQIRKRTFEERSSFGESSQEKCVVVLSWLAEKIGPVLTSKCILSNLLKSLSLCYVEEENLVTVDLASERADTLIKLSVVGDVSAWSVTGTILDISKIYGLCVLWDQCLPYCAELAKEGLRRLSPMHEAGLLGCMEMLSQILPQLTEESLKEHLPFKVVNEILFPVVELLTSFIHVFPNGEVTRRLLTVKWLNLVYHICVRIGRESARELITQPLLVKFFAVFTQLHGPDAGDSGEGGIPVPKKPMRSDSAPALGSPFVTIRKDQHSGELTIGTPVNIPIGSYPDSPPVAPTFSDDKEVLAELRAVFTNTLASDSYIPFCKLLGQYHLDQVLVDHDFLHEFCVAAPRDLVEQTDPSSPRIQITTNRQPRSLSQKIEGRSFEESGSRSHSLSASVEAFDRLHTMEGLQTTIAKEASSERYLRGNWLAHWQYELAMARKEGPWSVQQIPLQTFGAHASAVKSLYAFDNEYAFMSGSRDKTVRLWSIQNTGDGSHVSQSDGVYVEHKRSVFDIKFSTRERLALSCDGAVYVWDPWTLKTLKKIELSTQAICMDSSRAPNSSLFVGHLSEETCYVSRYDIRCCKDAASNTGVFRVSSNSAGLIRCLVTSPDNVWFACGFSSGVISVFDQRTGIMRATWKPYESDVLHLIPAGPSTLISVGTDNSVSLWDISEEPDDRLVYYVKGMADPVLQAYLAPRSRGSDLIALIGNSKVAVVPDFCEGRNTVNVTKLRHESFKGGFSSLAVLPLNQQLLVGHENGSVLLMC